MALHDTMRDVLPNVFFAVVGLLATYLLYNIFFHPLASIPGPFLGRFSELWKVQHMWKEDFSSALEALHFKHGRLVRIAPNEVSILDADAVQPIYGHGSKFVRVKTETWYGMWKRKGDPVPDHFSTTDPAMHSARRRTVANAYSMNSMLSFEPFLDECTSMLLKQLDARGDGKTQLDLAWWLQAYAFDAVGEIALGQNFGLLKEGRDDIGVLSTLLLLTQRNTIAGQLRWMHGIAQSNWFNITLAIFAGVNGHSFRDWVAKVFNARLQSPSEVERPDMFTLFKNAKETDGNKISDERLLGEVMTVLGAGSDTTGTSLRAFFFYVLQAPDVYKKVQAEIDEAFDNGTADDPITYAQAQKLSYFQACLKECMRLQPAVGMHLPRLVPAEGAVLAGHPFAAGSIVGVSPKLVHKTMEAYGPDAAQFRPERWSDATEEETRHLNKMNLAFGAGSRVCIGKNISLMEMSKILPTLVRHYDFDIVNKERPWKNHCQWFEVQTDLFVTCKKRDVF